MAVRIELFAIEGTGDFELVPHTTLDAAVAAFDAADADAVFPAGDGAVRCVGWLSASDDDEDRFTDWCEEVDDDLGIGLGRQGIGEAVGLTPPVLGPDDAATDGEWASAWSGVLRAALEAAAGGRVGWRTNFDVPGPASPDDDYPSGGRAAGASGTSAGAA